MIDRAFGGSLERAPHWGATIRGDGRTKVRPLQVSLFLIFNYLFQLRRNLRTRDARDVDRAVGGALDHDVDGAELARLVRIILAEMAAAALLALDRRERDRLGHRQQVLHVQRRVPAGVVFAVARDAEPGGALLVPLE